LRYYSRGTKKCCNHPRSPLLNRTKFKTWSRYLCNCNWLPSS